MINLKLKTRANEMILNYLPLAKNISAKFTYLPFEDRFQEACLALVKAYKTYDITRGYSFGNYARIVIVNHLRQYYAKEKDNFIFVLNEEAEYCDNRQDYEFVEFVEDFKREIGSFEWDIILEILKGKTQIECSEMFNISQSSISRILKRAKKIIKSLL